MSINVFELSDEELAALHSAISEEVSRRETMQLARAQIAALQDAYERVTMQETARQQVTEQLT